MEVVIGTYEEFLVGYTLSKKKGKYQLTQSFTNHAHCGSIRSVASSSKYLVSGSIDEVIHIISMKHRIESGTLVSHTGTITALEFLRSAFLFSASEDGNIGIWNTRKWECDKILRGHKDAVNSLSIHSSGKLLISVSKDKTLRTWNLVKGRCAYIVNLKDVSHQVLWSPSGVYFAVVFNDRIDMYDITTGGIFHSIEKAIFDKRINKVLFINDTTVIICGDCNDMVIYDLSSKRVHCKFTAHENRIKDMTWVNLKTIGSEMIDQETVDENDRWLVTTSSDGFIKIWSFDFSNLETEPTLISQVNSTCRPTCLTVWTANQNPVGKFDNFTIPELKISKEELAVCRDKIREKKAKRKLTGDKNTEEKLIKPTEENKETESVSPKPAKVKKVKISKKATVVKEKEQTIPTSPVAQLDDEDDEEAIRNMKASSEILKQMGKYKKNNKRNITTFKQRLQEKRAKRIASGGKDDDSRPRKSKFGEKSPGKPRFGDRKQSAGTNRPFRTFKKPSRSK